MSAIRGVLGGAVLAVGLGLPAPSVGGADLSDQADPHRGPDLAGRHHRHAGSRAGATADRVLRPDRDRREQPAGRGPYRHGLRREIPARRLHPDGELGCGVRRQSASLQQAVLRPDRRFCPDQRPWHQPAGAGAASVGAGQYVRRAGRARQEQAGRAQLRDLRHRHQRPSQHHVIRGRDRGEVHARPLSRRGAGDHRSARRPHPDDDRRHRAVAAKHRGRQAQGARHRQLRGACRNIPICRRCPRAGCRISRRARGTASPRPRARRARSSTSSAPRRKKFSPIRHSATNIWRRR